MPYVTAADQIASAISLFLQGLPHATICSDHFMGGPLSFNIVYVADSAETSVHTIATPSERQLLFGFLAWRRACGSQGSARRDFACPIPSQDLNSLHADVKPTKSLHVRIILRGNTIHPEFVTN